MSNDLDALFREYKTELNRLAYARLGNREDAADIVQDAFVRYATLVSGRQGPSAPIENPRHFLWRIVRNLAIDLGRHYHRRGPLVSIEDVEHQLIDPRQPDKELASRQELALLHTAIAELPPNCRSALLLNRLEGYTHLQIAVRLEVSASMVSKYIMQALRHCAKRLGLV